MRRGGSEKEKTNGGKLNGFLCHFMALVFFRLVIYFFSGATAFELLHIEEIKHEREEKYIKTVCLSLRCVFLENHVLQ